MLGAVVTTALKRNLRCALNEHFLLKSMFPTLQVSQARLEDLTGHSNEDSACASAGTRRARGIRL